MSDIRISALLNALEEHKDRISALESRLIAERSVSEAHLEKIKAFEAENAELKEDVSEWKDLARLSNRCSKEDFERLLGHIAKLERQNAEWKDDVMQHRDELAQALIRLMRLERAARAVCKVYWNFEVSMKAEIQELEAALDSVSHSSQPTHAAHNEIQPYEPDVNDKPIEKPAGVAGDSSESTESMNDKKACL